jgi:hypothetical protein
MNNEPIVIVVEDSFVIRGRGVLVAPSVEVGRLPNWTRLTIDLVDPDGNVRHVMGHFGNEHLSLIGGGSRWEGVIILDDDAGRVAPGTTLTARVAVKSS